MVAKQNHYSKCVNRQGFESALNRRKNTVPKLDAGLSSYTDSNKTLVLVFDCNIDTSETISSRITLQNAVTNPSDSFTLTETASGNDGTDINFILTDSHRDKIASWDAQGGALAVQISFGAVKGMSGTPNEDESSVQILWSKDESLCRLVSVSPQ